VRAGSQVAVREAGQVLWWGWSPEAHVRTRIGQQRLGHKSTAPTAQKANQRAGVNCARAGSQVAVLQGVVVSPTGNGARSAHVP